MKIEKACFYGVGVGPGDPELITLKAHRLIQSADVIAYLTNDLGRSQARDIAALTLLGSKPGQQELPIEVVMSRDRTAINRAYDQGAENITHALTKKTNVVFLCEGDPLFFGSFAYLITRVSEHFQCEVVPGICSMNAASAALKQPLALLQENLAVISGRSTDRQVIDALNSMDNVIILKAGRERPRLLTLLQKAGRMSEACYLEYIGRNEQAIARDVSGLSDEPGPYFSLFVINRSGTLRSLGRQELSL